MSGCEDQPVRELSGGMRRRVALLRALCCDWDILFLDEPFKGLDEETKKQVMDYTKEMCTGKTVIFVTHDSKEAAQMGAVCISLDHKEEERQ
ncbi:ATP-binding cassette domain-containing protein [Sellimonas catena]|uniref:ATP-binding cassette domain-containing protein n=1 Tax=Sellimonas catena TaxID=2994035 RepID=UPI003866B86E